jgi:xylulokinase
VDEAAKTGLDVYDTIIKQAAAVDPGSEGLIFLPYLAGERTPYADANARGVFVGLSLRHTKAHLSRAVMEGITMSLKDCLNLGGELGVNTESVVLSGGGARNETWCQMAADMFDFQVIRSSVDEGPAFGAAVLASVGAGFYHSVEQACDKLVSIRDAYVPDPKVVTNYEKLYTLYHPLYTLLKDHFKSSADFTLGA